MALNVGENIKKLRAERNVTQEQLAAHLSITYQSVSKWENNVTAPDLYLIPVIADYFEVPIDELFKPNMQGYKNKAARLFAIFESSYTKENFEKVEAEYQKLVNENTADAEDICMYGVVYQYRALHLNRKSEELLRKAIEMGNARAEGQLNLLLADMGRNSENIEKYEQMVKDDPKTLNNWCFLVDAYGREANNHEKALETAKKAFERFPNNARLLSSCGDICRGMKKFDDAYGYYTKSIAQAPNMGGNYYSLAFMYTEMGEYEKAIGAWEDVIALFSRLGMCAEEIELSSAWPKQEIAKLQAQIDGR